LLELTEKHERFLAEIQLANKDKDKLREELENERH